MKVFRAKKERSVEDAEQGVEENDGENHGALEWGILIYAQVRLVTQKHPRLQQNTFLIYFTKRRKKNMAPCFLVVCVIQKSHHAAPFLQIEKKTKSFLDELKLPETPLEVAEEPDDVGENAAKEEREEAGIHHFIFAAAFLLLQQG